MAMDLPTAIEHGCKGKDAPIIEALLLADELLRLGFVQADTTFDVVDMGSNGVFLFPRPKSARLGQLGEGVWGSANERPPREGPAWKKLREWRRRRS